MSILLTRSRYALFWIQILSVNDGCVLNYLIKDDVVQEYHQARTQLIIPKTLHFIKQGSDMYSFTQFIHWRNDGCVLYYIIKVDVLNCVLRYLSHLHHTGSCTAAHRPLRCPAGWEGQSTLCRGPDWHALWATGTAKPSDSHIQTCYQSASWKTKQVSML